jgi:hypothetical protein
MNNLFNKFKGYFSQGTQNSQQQNDNKVNENILKEEEDPFENLIKEVCLIKGNQDNFENEMENIIMNQINKYTPNLREIDYKAQSMINSNESICEMNDLDKMKLIGKIYVDENSKLCNFSANFKHTYNSDRLQADSNFPTAKSKNCFFKGKWFYEVRIITNGLFQIGWAKYDTKTSSTMGVGDDYGSYACDGFRMSVWNGDQNEGFKAWDVGDIVGCCIDLDIGYIEYFINGTSLGIRNENLKIGVNEAYFPAITCSNKEKFIVNVGQSKIEYEYVSSKTKEKFNSCDIPMSIYNGLNDTTNNILAIINTLSKDSSNTICTLLSAYNFISNNSCNDIYCLKYIIIPFIIDTTKPSSNERREILEHIFNNSSSIKSTTLNILQSK